MAAGKWLEQARLLLVTEEAFSTWLREQKKRPLSKALERETNS